MTRDSEVFSGARILVVDDDAEARALLLLLLRARWRADGAYDGESAWEALTRERYDLVLADVVMPRLDGVGLLRRMRADPRTRETLVVLVSARGDEDARVGGMEAGADDFLVKPFSPSELVARVRVLLKLALAREERLVLLERERAARAEAELQKDHLRALFMQAPTPIAMLRGRGYVVELVNLCACGMWGRPCEDLVGRPLFEALPELDGLVSRPMLDAVMHTGETQIGREASARRDGTFEAGYFNVVYAPLRGVEGAVAGVMLLAFDVTEEVRAREQAKQEAHRALLRQLVRAQEDERRRIARDLHDQTGQLLAVLSFAANSIAAEGLSPASRASLARLRGAADELSRQVRDLALRLRPTALDDLGLGAAVRSALEDFAATSGLEVDFDASSLGAERIPREVETVLFRAVQEALTNAVRHARARRVSVAIERVGDTAVAVVEDDGCGFDADSLDGMARHGRLGLLGMQERVSLAGGSLQVESAPGQGTTVVVRVPLVARSER